MTAYCSMAFLKKLTSDFGSDFVNFENLNRAKYSIDLIDFLLYGCQVKTDLSEEEIELNFDDPYVKCLMKRGKIVSAKDQFNTFDKNHGTFFFEKMDEQVPLLLMNSLTEVEEKSIEDAQGLHCISSKDKISVLFEEKTKTFLNKNPTDWLFAKEFLHPHNAIVIADPYLYTNDTLSSLVSLLKSTVSKSLKKKYHITLLGCSRRKGIKDDEAFLIKNIVRSKLQLIESFPTLNINLDYHFYNGEEFHDRYIITNNTCIFSGYGLDIVKNGVSKKDGTWLAFKPFKRLTINGKEGVFFFSIMKEKLKLMSGWIEKEDKLKSSNPLLLV